MAMWEPFTEHARRAMVLAQEVAQDFGSQFIEAEHIVIGVVQQGSSPTANALAALGLTEQRVINAAKVVLPHEKAQQHQEMNFQPAAKRVIEFAFEQAQSLENNFIGSEHLILGYVRAYENGSAFLNELSVTPSELRGAVLDVVKRGPARVTEARHKGLDAAYALTAGINLSTMTRTELWAALSTAAENANTKDLLAYALLIARKEGWSAGDLSAHAAALIKRRFPSEP